MGSLPGLTPLAAMRWSIVGPIVDELRPQSILEIGCGQGAVGARLAAYAPYIGLEPDATSFAAAKNRIEPHGGQVRNGSIHAVPPDETFDLVCAFEVIEHLESDVAAVTHWGRLLAPGGHLLISTPAWPDRFGRWDAMVGHYRRYTPDGLSALLADAGFDDIDLKLYGWPLGYASESVRNRIAARRASRFPMNGEPMQARTARSGRQLQPHRLAGPIVRAAVAPFVMLQRYQPKKGMGLVALAARS